MSVIDAWLRGEGDLDLKDPDVVRDLRRRWWLAEARDFAEDAGLPLDDEFIEQLAQDLYRLEGLHGSEATL